MRRSARQPAWSYSGSKPAAKSLPVSIAWPNRSVEIRAGVAVEFVLIEKGDSHSRRGFDPQQVKAVGQHATDEVTQA